MRDTGVRVALSAESVRIPRTKKTIICLWSPRGTEGSAYADEDEVGVLKLRSGGEKYE